MLRLCEKPNTYSQTCLNNHYILDSKMLIVCLMTDHCEIGNNFLLNLYLYNEQMFAILRSVAGLAILKATFQSYFSCELGCSFPSKLGNQFWKSSVLKKQIQSAYLFCYISNLYKNMVKWRDISCHLYFHWQTVYTIDTVWEAA